MAHSISEGPGSEVVHLHDVPGGRGLKGILTGPRIPVDYFVSTGFGETDAGGGVDPWETGSYDLALEEAGIENCNVMQYTSVMPPESRKITRDQAQANFHHGAVLECIMATINGVQGDRLSAGVACMNVRHKSDGSLVGGYAAEYRGHAKEEDVRKVLQSDLNDIFSRRYDTKEYEYGKAEFTTVVRDVKKGFGTVLAAICFVSYLHPVFVRTEAAAEEANGDVTEEGGMKKSKKKAEADGDKSSPEKKKRKKKDQD